MGFPTRARWSVRMYLESEHRFHTADAPGAFHRLMQFLQLGIVWEPLEGPLPWYLRLSAWLKREQP